MQLSIYEWIQFAVIFLTIASIGLAHLKNQTFVVKSTAWTNVVSAASNIVAQIEETLKGDSISTTRATLIDQGVAELKQIYAESLAKTKLPVTLVDGVLTLLLQRLTAKLPTDLSGILSQVVTPGPAVVSPSGMVIPPKATLARRSTVAFLRTIGPVRNV